MLQPRYRKILRDLYNYKTRTLLAVLSIAVGVFAVGAIMHSRLILERDMNGTYMAANPAHAILFTDTFDDEMVWSIRKVPNVTAAEGRRSVTVRLLVGEEEWRDFSLNAIADYKDIQVNKVWPISGAWPPKQHEVLIERSSLGLTNAEVGDTVTVELSSGKLRTMRISGLVHDINQPPAQFTGEPIGFIDSTTIEWLGASSDYDELSITVSSDGDAGELPSEEHIKHVAAEVSKKLEKSGRIVYFTWIPTPGQHPADDTIQPLLLIMGVLGGLSLGLAAILVVNTISSLMMQQITQIGMMKAVGARRGQIMVMYFLMVLAFGLLALLLAIPISLAGTRAFVDYMAGLINFDVVSYSPPLHILLVEMAIALLIPLLAAVYPVLSGTSITVREALDFHGLGKGKFGTTWTSRLLERVRGLSRPMLISLRNTFRRQGRLALTLTTLTLGGAIFIAVFSVRDSLLLTLDDAFEYWNYNVSVNFNRAYRAKLVEGLALDVPGVERVECWGFRTIRRVHDDETESGNMFMFAPPSDTDFLRPTLLEGRWLLPEDDNAVVLNTEILKDETDIQIGDEITLKIDGDESNWRVVGTVRGVLTGPIAYANRDFFMRFLGDVERVGGIQIVTAQDDKAFEEQVVKTLEEYYESNGIQISSTDITSTIREQVEYQFNILVVLLLIMAVLLAIVGGLGLMSTMSINVLERTREIGVMRAVGASDGAVLRIVIGEGILIGLLSWLIGTVLAIPISKLLSNQVGSSLFQAPLSYIYSINGMLLWLIIVVVLATLASFLPARSASRITVWEVLAYE